MSTSKFLIILLSTFILLTIGCESKGGGSSGGNGGNNEGGANGDGIYDLYPDLPPDPGEAGKVTLEGIDSNNDGVRDDLEIAIYEYASKTEEENLRKAMRQDAKARQLAIIAGHTQDPQEIEEARKAGFKSLMCAFRKMRSDYENWDFFTYMDGKAANTPERLVAYIRFDEVISDKVYGDAVDQNPCD
jgi:hypothetical protein